MATPRSSTLSSVQPIKSHKSPLPGIMPNNLRATLVKFASYIRKEKVPAVVAVTDVINSAFEIYYKNWTKF